MATALLALGPWSADAAAAVAARVAAGVAKSGCTIVGTAGPDVLVGTAADDVICGRGGDDRLLGRGGDDELRGGHGDDELVGGPGSDLLRGEHGADTITGGLGGDYLRGGRDDDRLDGRDAHGYEDLVRCGPGSGDEAFADPLDDVVSGCEVINQNDPPTDITLAPSTVAENATAGTVVGKLKATDPDQNDKHKFALVSGPGSGDNGSFTIKGRKLRTAAALDFEADPTLSIRVRATDKAGEVFAKSLTVTVTDVFENIAPVAVDDTRTTPEDTRLDLPVSGAGSPAANDTDASGDPLTVTAVSGAVGGTATIVAGTIRFTPTADLCGPAKGRFDYTVSDTHGGTDQGRVTVDITCVPDDPTASDDIATVGEDAAATAVPVLANDGDADGDALTIDSVTQPAHGTVAITGVGTGLTYKPDADYCNAPPGTAPDTFTYSLMPGGSTATVSVTVTCDDDAPVAVDDSETVTEDDPATLIDVRANDTDVDAGPNTVVSVTQPDHGAVLITTGGLGVTYLPDADYCNSGGGPDDTFTYTLNGGDSATVDVTVTCVQDDPVAVDDSKTVVEGDPATTIDVLANDTDVDAGPISIDSVTQPANGTVVITNTGSDLTYAPDPDYCNSGADPDDTFTYTLNGGDSATVSVEVTCVDDDPVAVDDSATLAEDSGASAVDVLANDTDIDGGPKSVESVTQPANGAVVITGGGTGVTYAPNANYCNNPPGTTPDTFTYTITGGDTATVSATVTCSDDPPVAVDDSATTTVDASASPLGVLANDTDIDGGPLSIDEVTQPDNGAVVITGGGTGLTYQPDPGYCNDGTPKDTFTYTLNGGDSATVSVTVICDEPPAAVDDSATVSEDSGATAVDVLGNDTDTDGGPISVDEVTQPANGTVGITGGGTGVDYTPSADYCNSPPGITTDDFTYTLAPGGDTATVSMTVTCVDDPPSAVDDSATVAEDSSANVVDVLANDTDIDGGPITVDSVTQPGNGTSAVTGGGTGVSYTPNADYCNNPPGTSPDTFTYTLNGGDSATVSMTVTCGNDAPEVTTSGTLAYTENDPATAIAPGLTVTDADAGATIAGATVALTAGYTSAQDVLALGNAGSHTPITASFNSLSGVLTLSGSASPAAYQAALRDVTYLNTSEDPSTATRTVTFTVTDDTALTGSDTRDISVTAVDDPPVAVNDSATVLEDASAASVPVLTNDTDVDSGPKTVQLVTQPANGSVAITGGGTGLTYQPNANYCNDPPGSSPDTFTYTLNGGSTATVSVTVTCVNDAPVADDETFNGTSRAVGNTALVADAPGGGTPDPDGPQKTISGDVLAGDTDIDGPGPLEVVAGTLATNDGGSVTIAANGDFVYTPAAGVSCSDTSDFFDYTLTDKYAGTAGTDVGRVTIAIADCVWYVDASAAAGGDGTSGSPFNTLGSLNGAGGAGDSDAANHKLFLYDGTYAGGLPLEAGQVVFGQRHGLVVPDGGAGNVTLETAVPAGAPSQVNGGVVLATVNTLQGVDLGNATGAALSGTTVGNVTFNTATAGKIDNTTGGAVNINGGALDMAFTSVSSTGSTGAGIGLTGVSGTFTASGGTLSNATGADVALSGGSADVTYGGTISDDQGTLVSISGETGGTKDFNGAITDLVDGDGNGVTLTGNTGATIRFDGGLNLSTGVNPALVATGGGTVAVTDPNAVGTTPDNTLATTTGRALNVSNTTIQANGLTFRSISSNGAASGILLNTTGASGRLVVTGNGGTCTVADTTGCSGGQIANGAGADSASTTPDGSGIVLNSTLNPSFTRVWVHDHSNYGIRGTGVAGLTVLDSVVNGVNGTSALTANKDGSLRFEELTGTVAMTNVAISGGYFTNLMVDNTTGVLNATLDNVDSGSLDTTGGDDAVQFEGIGTSDVNVEYKNSSITTAGGDLFQYIGDGTGGGDLDLTNNTLSNNDPTINTGGGGVALVAGAKGPATMDVVGNSMQDSKTNALTIIKSADAAAGTNDLVANVNNNSIGLAATVNSGSLEGDGMEITTFGDGNATFNVTNNVVRQYNSSGMQFVAGSGVAGTGQLNLNISGNTLANPGTNPLITLLQGIRVDSGVAAADTFATCVKFGANSITGSSDAANKDFRLVASQSTTIRQPGYAGANNDGVAFASFAAALIGGGAVGTAVANAPATFSGTGSTCP